MLPSTYAVLAADQETRPAGGAALGEVVLASALGLGLTAVLLGAVLLHRTGRTTVLTSIGEKIGRATGMPPWVAVPVALATSSLLTALLGMLWDISLHIGVGRDEGPLANPAHYLILFGLFGVFAAGVLACAMPQGIRPGPAAVRFVTGWHVPVGGILLAASGFYALIGFPLDDVWHRIFGQDVTLWGPTHLMLIGGAGLSLIGIQLLEQEGRAFVREQTGDSAPTRAGTRVQFIRRAMALGGLLLGMSVFQGEFDFDVPQFRAVLEPLMVAGAAGIALVTARLFMGRGGALAAATFFLVIRGGITLLVGPVFGEIPPSLPLYLGSAILVELLALTPLLRRPLLFAGVAGVAIGTVGFATEVVWREYTHVLGWGGDMLVEGTLMAVVGGVTGALFGALLALGLGRRLPRPAVARTVFVASLLALSMAVVNGLVATVPDGVRATFQFDEVDPDPRTANVQVTIQPADAVDDPTWIQITAWQGDGLVVTELERTGPGQYRTTEPVPLHGTWKTLLRIHDGRELYAMPIYLPEDPVIEAAAVPATDGVTRDAVPEVDILQRELKDDSPTWLWAV
ncbi:MAG: hypothetical protein EPN99_14725, partial [Frankiales bacterium]